MEIKTDDLAYWFLRLNGFLTIVNFVVHQEERGYTGTDVDVLGVRFPYRAELLEATNVVPMEDYKEFTRITVRPFVTITEVKKGKCGLNGPWTKRNKKNMDRVLRATGVLPHEDIKQASDKLYQVGVFENSRVYFSLMCIGDYRNEKIHENYRQVPQIIWSEITSFIYRRFNDYSNQKSWHDPWDENGKKLWNTYKKYPNNESGFQASIDIISPINE